MARKKGDTDIPVIVKVLIHDITTNPNRLATYDDIAKFFGVSKHTVEGISKGRVHITPNRTNINKLEITDSLISKIIQLRKKGYSYYKIAKKLRYTGISRSTVRNIYLRSKK